MATTLVGIDIGGTSTEAVILSPIGAVAGRASLPTDTGDAAATVASAASAAEIVLDNAGVSAANVTAVGIGVPGLVDPVAGTVRHALNLGIGHEGVDIGPRVAAALDLPAFVENDVRAAALGVYIDLRRTLPSLRHLAYVSLGTGISAGLVLDGRLHRGEGGVAGEIGHVVADPVGPQCRCGLVGCLESIVSGWAVAATGATLSETFDRDPERSAQIAAALANALYGLVLSCGVERIVLGGGGVRHTPALLDAALSALSAMEAQSAFAAELAVSSRISHADPSVPVGAIGAALAAGRRFGTAGPASHFTTTHEQGA